MAWLLCSRCRVRPGDYRRRDIGGPHRAASSDQPLCHECVISLRLLMLRRLSWASRVAQRTGQRVTVRVDPDGR